MDYIKKRKRRDPRRKKEKVKLEFLKYGLSIRMGMGSYGLTIRIVNSQTIRRKKRKEQRRKNKKKGKARIF